MKAADAALAAAALAKEKQLPVRKVSELFLGTRGGPWTKRYSQILNLHILPDLGDRKAAEVGRADIQAIVDRLAGEGHNVQARLQ